MPPEVLGVFAERNQGRRYRSAGARLVVDPAVASQLSLELEALANAHPELVESATLLRLAGRTIDKQRADVVELRGMFSSVKASLALHIRKMEDYMCAATED